MGDDRLPGAVARHGAVPPLGDAAVVYALLAAERRGDVREPRLHRGTRGLRVHARRVVVVAGMVDAIRDALAVEDEKGGGDARAVARSNVDALRLHPPLVVHRRERAIAVVLGRHRVGVALGARHRPRHLRDERARKRGRDERHAGVEIDLDLPRRRAGVRRGLHVIPADECAAQREAQGGQRERRGTAGERPSRHRVPPTACVVAPTLGQTNSHQQLEKHSQHGEAPRLF